MHVVFNILTLTIDRQLLVYLQCNMHTYLHALYTYINTFTSLIHFQNIYSFYEVKKSNQNFYNFSIYFKLPRETIQGSVKLNLELKI